MANTRFPTDMLEKATGLKDDDVLLLGDSDDSDLSKYLKLSAMKAFSLDGLIDTDNTLSGDSDLVVPSQKAIKYYVDNAVLEENLWDRALGILSPHNSGDSILAEIISDFDTTWDTRLASKDTDDLTEGDNLYYTQARFDTAFSLKTTNDLTESINLYYTQARFDTAFTAKSTTDLTEGDNLYYTEARVKALFSATAPITFTDGLIALDITGNLQVNGTDLDTIQDIKTTDSPTFAQVTLNNEATANSDVPRWDQVLSLFEGLHWKEAVIDFSDAPPESPTTGDRYIVGTGSGAFAGEDDNFTEYNGATWDFEDSEEGDTCWNKTEDTNFTFNGTAWVELGSTVSHNNTTGLQGGTSDEYYHLTSAQHAIATQASTTALSGYLTNTDWDTFNEKAEANQTMYIGTTGVAINRASSALTLAGLTLTTPDLGTPTTLIGTNITGTGASFTAGNVTTNANLTGVITSVGNATSIASQTGTGTKFVVDTSPTLVTPEIGVATGTSLDLSSDLTLANTTNADLNGIIYKGATPFMHNFNYGDNGTVTTTGYNTFVGGAGNLTMGSTATQTYHASYNTGIGYRSLFSNTTGYQNTANGYASLYSNTTGANNTANGLNSLNSNTTGYQNTANGYASLYSNTTGYSNTANGMYSLYSNTTGANNTANGHASLFSNTTGANNTANGMYSLYSNTTGNYNTANGYASLYSNTTGYRNTANGNYSLYSNTTGFRNTANGNYSLYSNTTGFRNTANGMYSLNSNTTGNYNTANGMYSLYLNTTGSNNTANGYASLNSNTTGYQNTANGYNSLYSNTTGNYNTANGMYSLYLNTTGSNNTANGYQAGRYIADGTTANETSTTSVYLGANTKANASGDTNEIVIGYGAIGQGSNTIMLGNSSITGLYCYDTSIASPSDRRVKENITEIGNSKLLDFITKLEPITYNKKNQCDWDNDIKLSNYKDIEVDEIEEYEEVIKGETVKKQRTVKKIHKAEKRPETDTKTYAGMVAQDVEIAMVESGVDYELVNTADNGMKTLRYGDLIPALIGAVKAQQTQIENLQIEVDRLTNSK